MFAMMLSAPHQALEPVHRPDPAPSPGFSAANLTRQDGLDYLPMAAAARHALSAERGQPGGPGSSRGAFTGAAMLVPSPD